MTTVATELTRATVRLITSIQKHYKYKPIMPSERVWSKFEVKRKDGTVLKMRTQDVPQARIDDVVEIMMTYFFAEEAVHKAVGICKDAESLAKYKTLVVSSFDKPSYSIVICCADEDEIKDIMGVSLMLITDSNDDSAKEIEDKLKENGTPLLEKLKRIFKECGELFDPIKEYSLKKLYEDRGLCVVPEYRKLGIAGQLLKVRRIMCKAHGIPMTGAWMTAHGTQTAATRDGWKTVQEINYDYVGNKHGITFIDVPPTMKYMVADDK